MNAKIQHCRDNAHQAEVDACHYLGRYQAFKCAGIRRRDAAAHLWKVRSLRRLAKGYERQAEALEREAAKQTDIFEVAQAEDFAVCCGCGLSSPVSSLIVEGPNEYRCEPCTSAEVAEPFKLEPTPVIVGKQLAMLQTEGDRNQMDMFR
jgi:hypothetical protein